MSGHITHHPAYQTVDRDDFDSMEELRDINRSRKKIGASAKRIPVA